MPTIARTVRLQDDTSQDLDQIASICERDANFIMRQAIEEYIEHHKWMIEETQRRLEKRAQGKARFLSHDDVKASLLKRMKGK